MKLKSQIPGQERSLAELVDEQRSHYNRLPADGSGAREVERLEYLLQHPSELDRLEKIAEHPPKWAIEATRSLLNPLRVETVEGLEAKVMEDGSFTRRELDQLIKLVEHPPRFSTEYARALLKELVRTGEELLKSHRGTEAIPPSSIKEALANLFFPARADYAEIGSKLPAVTRELARRSLLREEELWKHAREAGIVIEPITPTEPADIPSGGLTFAHELMRRPIDPANEEDVWAPLEEFVRTDESGREALWAKLKAIPPAEWADVDAAELIASIVEKKR